MKITRMMVPREYVTLILGSTLILLIDKVMEHHGDNWWISKPNIGIQKCFLHDSSGMYFYLPILLLMIANGVFLVLTTVALHRYIIFTSYTMTYTIYRHNLSTQSARNSTRNSARMEMMGICRTNTRMSKDMREQLVAMP